MQDNGMMQLNQDASFQEFACTALVFVVGVVIITFHAIETSYGEATNHSTQHSDKARNARSETRLQGYTTPLSRPFRTLISVSTPCSYRFVDDEALLSLSNCLNSLSCNFCTMSTTFRVCAASPTNPNSRCTSLSSSRWTLGGRLWLRYLSYSEALQSQGSDVSDCLEFSGTRVSVCSSS